MKTFADGRLRIMQGDITKLEADAGVSTAISTGLYGFSFSEKAAKIAFAAVQ